MGNNGILEPPFTNRGVVTDEKSPLNALIDWVSITFKDVQLLTVIEEVLQFDINFMQYEPIGRFRYIGKYKFADIELLVPPETYKEMGYHLYMTGRACRQMEIYFTAQKRTWLDFFQSCLTFGGKFTRIDIAIDDRKTYFDILNLNNKANRGECISRFRKKVFYDKSNINGDRAGRTITFGSRESNVMVVFYEKNYEQAEKRNEAVEESEQWNRYEIRIKNESANICIAELIRNGDIRYIGISILSNYLRFVVRNKNNKQHDLWEIWKPWEQFIKDVEKLRLSMSPAPRTLEQKRQWIKDYVAPTLKILQKADDNLGDTFLKDTIDNAELKPKHKEILWDYLQSVNDYRNQEKSNGIEDI